MATSEELVADATTRMDKSVEHARNEFNTVRTGRASAALLDRIQVSYYGTPTPLNQLATVGVPEPRLITIQPFDPSSIKAIEKAIQESDLGLQPSNDGKVVRLPVPPAKMTTRPFSRWRIARRLMYGSATSSIVRADCTRVMTPSRSSASCIASALSTVASMPA